MVRGKLYSLSNVHTDHNIWILYLNDIGVHIRIPLLWILYLNDIGVHIRIPLLWILYLNDIGVHIRIPLLSQVSGVAAIFAPEYSRYTVVLQ